MATRAVAAIRSQRRVIADATASHTPRKTSTPTSQPKYALWSANDRSLDRAAEALHVARNTVAHRVKRYESLTAEIPETTALRLGSALIVAAFLDNRASDEP
jgi:PucR C-terminal helix-turn-helix domain